MKSRAGDMSYSEESEVGCAGTNVRESQNGRSSPVIGHSFIAARDGIASLNALFLKPLIPQLFLPSFPSFRQNSKYPHLSSLYLRSPWFTFSITFSTGVIGMYTTGL
jgi:hypothetical protein